MRRLPLTLTLTALTALTLTTAALAAPPAPDTVDCPLADDAPMAVMHDDPEAMLAMHDQMLAMHPEMADHLDDRDIDVERMREAMAAGLGHDELHGRMHDAGVDLEAMHADCPMVGGAMHHGDDVPHGDTMPGGATMPHGDASSHGDHHR